MDGSPIATPLNGSLHSLSAMEAASHEKHHPTLLDLRPY